MRSARAMSKRLFTAKVAVRGASYECFYSCSCCCIYQEITVSVSNDLSDLKGNVRINETYIGMIVLILLVFVSLYSAAKL